MQENLGQALVSKVDEFVPVLKLLANDQSAFPGLSTVQQLQNLKVQCFFSCKLALSREAVLRNGIDVGCRIIVVEVGVKLKKSARIIIPVNSIGSMK